MYEPKNRRKIFFSALLVFDQGLLLVGYSWYWGRLVLGPEHELARTGAEMHASAGDLAAENDGIDFSTTKSLTREMHILRKYSELVRTPFQLPNGIVPGHSGDGGVRLACPESGNLYAHEWGGR
jgi:hypothetical protein